MSVKKLVSTRNLFVNTDDAPDSDGVRARYNLPTGVIDCESNQTMTLTLSSFNMRKGFYSVNQTNNVFYILNVETANTIKATRCVIEPGDYRFFWADDDNLNGDYTNWIETETNPRPPAIQKATLATAVKAAILNSTTHDITMTTVTSGTSTTYKYTAVVSKPAFKGPNTISITEAGDAAPNALGQDLTNAVPDAITVTWSPLKGIFEIIFDEVSKEAGTLKFAGFYVKSFVSDPSRLNIYEQIITIPDGTREDLDLFQSSFELLGGCGEIRERPIGTTVTEQFNNLQPLFTKEGREQEISGRIVSIDGGPANQNIFIEPASTAPGTLPPTQFFGFIPADLNTANMPSAITNPPLTGPDQQYTMLLLWVNNGTVANSYFSTKRIYFLKSNFQSRSVGAVTSLAIDVDLFKEARTLPLGASSTQPFATTNFAYEVQQPGDPGPSINVIISDTEAQAFRGQYKASLELNECIYVRTNLPSKNYQTLGFDTSIAQTPEVQPSQILAKIPLNNPTDFQQYITEDKFIEIPFGNNALINNGLQDGSDPDPGTYPGPFTTFTIPSNPNLRVGDIIQPQRAIKALPGVGTGDPTTYTTDFPPNTKIIAIDYDEGTANYIITTSAANSGKLDIGYTMKLLTKQILIYRNQIPYEFISYEDNGNGLYSLDLTTPHVSQIEIFLTDSFGRLLPFTSEEQARCKALSFSCDLRIDTYEEVITRTIEVGMKK